MIFQRPTYVLRYTWKLVSKCCTPMSFCVSNVKQYLNYPHIVDMDPSFLRRFCDHRHCTLSRDTESWSDLCEELRSTALIVKLHRESKKTRHQTLGHNFTKYYPIFKKFLLPDSVVNLQQIHVQILHHALNMSLYYLVKYECRKMASSWNTYCNYWWITK